MRKVKTLLILLLTAGLIGLGAILPGIIGAVQDRDTLNAISYGSIQSLNLELRAQRQPLTVVDKLTLLLEENTIPITAKEASMTEEEVYTIAVAMMDRFVAGGIAAWFDPASQSAEPFLCVSSGDPNVYNIFWTVRLANEAAPYEYVMMDIDDETGTVLSVRYDYADDDNSVSDASETSWEKNYATLETFSSLFLQQLGVSEEVNVEPVIDEYLMLDGGVLLGRFYFTDDGGNKIGLEFYVSGSGGFWTNFP